MDIMTILGSAMHYNDVFDNNEESITYDIDNASLIRDIHAYYEKDYKEGEQCAVVIGKRECEVIGFVLYNAKTHTHQTVYLDDEVDIPEKYKFVYHVMCCALIHNN